MADNSILTRLDGLKLKYEEIGQKLTDPEVIADVKQFIQFNKEYRELEPIIEASERYRTAIANLAEAKARLWQTEQDYRRYERLLKEESVPEQQYDQAKASYEAARAHYDETSKKQVGVEAGILRAEAASPASRSAR